MSKDPSSSQQPSGPPREPDPKHLQMIVKENGERLTNRPGQDRKEHR